MAKLFKNMKIGAKIGVVISIVLIVGLTLLTVLSINSVKNTTEVDSSNRLGELANSRAKLIETYFDDYTAYFYALATNPDIIDALSHLDVKKWLPLSLLLIRT